MRSRWYNQYSLTHAQNRYPWPLAVILVYVVTSKIWDAIINDDMVDLVRDISLTNQSSYFIGWV